ncbi:MAG: flagellar basal body rod protein FlgC [Microbacteriaceae bacterium]|nr:flagellar basal body rod protein FlgC [Microbacteriaceae bacterium]
MSIFNSMSLSGSALTAERLRMDVISNNIANSQTTRTEDGGAYKRKQVILQEQGSNGLPVNRFRSSAGLPQESDLSGVKVVRVVEDGENMVRTYDPQHPDADAEGFVEYPNVDITTEMVDLMAASKAYQANVTVVQTLKSMAQSALQIGK